MNPWIALVACLIVTLAACAGTVLALVWALALRRRARELEATYGDLETAYKDEQITVTAYRNAFGDWLNTLTRNGEQP